MGFAVDAIDKVRDATQKIADFPLVQGLISAGFTLPTTVEEPTDFPDIALSQGGRDLFTAIGTINQRIDELGLPDAAPDLSQMPGSSAGSPMYILDAAPDRVRKVEIVGGKIDNVGEVGAIKGQVDVKQVGTVEVTQAGEFVMRLSSGETIPVYVQGGQVQANLSHG